MTAIIFRGLEQNKFRLTEFYLSRANRIIPALSVVSVATLATGTILLAPEELKTLGKHVAHSAGFISNITYQGESGYFDIASHEKWLLHTWSLSVEWQFYVAFPFIILTVRKVLTQQSAKLSLVITALFSLLACLSIPETSQTNAFYSLSSRAWEMMAGGIAYLYPLKLKQKMACLSGVSGVILIIGCSLTLNENITWPGALTLIPVIGAWLVITANQQNSVLTNNLIMQKSGSWSYSIYLWHWPLFVFLNTVNLNSTLWLITGIILSIFLGYLSYNFIEQRIRFRKAIHGSALLTHPTLIITAIIVALGQTVYQSDGYPQRFSDGVKNTFLLVQPSPLREACHSREKSPIPAHRSCSYFSDNITWAVFGDSHTVELSYSLAEALKDLNEGIRHYSFSGCIPSYKQEPSFSECTQWTNEAIADITARANIHSVLINFRYPRVFYGEPGSSKSKTISEQQRDRIKWSLTEMINDLAKHKKHVYVMLPIPELNERMPTILSRNYHYGQQHFSDIRGPDIKEFNQRSADIYRFFSENTFPSNVTLIDPREHFCDLQSCYALRNGIPLYFDDDHPSVAGAGLMLSPVIADILNENEASSVNK